MCSLLTPDAPGLSFLEPLQQAVAGSGTAFNCSSQLAAFDAAQATPASATTPALSTPAPSAPVSSAPSSSAGQAAAGQVYGILGEPDQSVTSSLGGYLNQLLGGAP